MNMSENSQDLAGVAETLLIPLYVRALETERPDALLKDERAVALVAQMRPAFSRIDELKLDEGDRLAIVLRNREFDRNARAFMTQHPQAVVVHIGCGLDARFDRVDDGRVEWYDLDLPEVIELRRKHVATVGRRHHLVACSVFDGQWLDMLSVHHARPILFMAEGVLMYFEEVQVKSLVLTLRERFAGAELVFDAFTPCLVRMNNLRMRRTKLGARYGWGLKRAKDIETWSPGIRLLTEWFPFSRPEPRLASLRWVRYVPPLAKVMGVFHYQLGETVR
jgi:O-methyltransferase involved in polyketide biosynthesis